MPYAIIVKVPDAKDDCFIAMPFAEKFKAAYTPIMMAASQLRLHPVRIKTGEMQPGVDFDVDIVNATRSARMVVAVCSPEPATSKPNPNVMYELGWAHALGKPTLILTSDIRTLPSDLAVKHVLTYEETEIGTDEFTRKIKENMRDILERMSKDNPLTDPIHEDIYVASERHLMFHNPAFWDHFRIILSFAKNTHDEHQQLDTAVIDKLLTEANEMYENPGQAQRVSSFLKAWKNYDTYYHNRTLPNVHEQLGDSLREVDNSLAFLKTEGGHLLRRNVNDCDGFYGKIKAKLTEYSDLYKETAKWAESDSLPRQKDPDAINKCFFQINLLSKETKSIVMNSDRLIVNLIEMIRKPGD